MADNKQTQVAQIKLFLAQGNLSGMYRYIAENIYIAATPSGTTFDTQVWLKSAAYIAEPGPANTNTEFGDTILISYR